MGQPEQVGSMEIKPKHIRGAYGKPLGGKLNIQLTKEDLTAFGKLCVKYIEEEARAAASYSKSIPKDEAFFKSFSFKISGSSTVKILSSWDWIGIYQNLQEQGFEKDAAFGKPRPFRMTWLTKSAGVDKVPLFDKQTGQIVIRSAPLKAADAWIHPGIARHTFINKAMKRAREEFIGERVALAIQKQLGGS